MKIDIFAVKRIQSGLLEDYCKYKTFLNKLTSLKRIARNNYWKNETRLYGQNKAKIWQFVNQITHFKRKSPTSIKSLIDKQGKKLTDPTDIANWSTLKKKVKKMAKI